MANNKVILKSAIVLIIIITCVFFLTRSQNRDEPIRTYKEIIPISFEVTDQKIVGINADNDSLKFGTIMQGNFAERSITIVNPFNTTIAVQISVDKKIENIATLSLQDFKIQKGERKKITIHIAPTTATSLGNHTANLTVMLKETSA